MGNYEQEREFLKTTPLDESFIAVGKHRIYPLILLAEYKAYIIEQSKKGKTTFNTCLAIAVTEGGINGSTNRAVEMYANQFIPAAPAEQWISVKDKPNESGAYWCYVEEQSDLGLSHFQWNCCYDIIENSWYDNDESMIVTHWMPLPAAPESTTSNKQP